jgi:hypothetical protein
VGFYGNPSWLETYVDKTGIVGKYDLWLAAWTESPDVSTKYQYNQQVWQWGLLEPDGKGSYKYGNTKTPTASSLDGNVSYFDYQSNTPNSTTSTSTNNTTSTATNSTTATTSVNISLNTASLTAIKSKLAEIKNDIANIESLLK